MDSEGRVRREVSVKEIPEALQYAKSVMNFCLTFPLNDSEALEGMPHSGV